MADDTRKSDKNAQKDKKKTPKKWESIPDARKDKGAGKYPNQIVVNTRSGHNWVIDDSPGKESMTFQHRGGSAISFMPNGAIQMTAHNSLYNLVFGQNRLSITGANDLTVKGDGSLMVYGDFNKTVHGNTNWTSTGDFNITAENLNRMIRGNIDTEAKNETKKLEGSSALTAQGAVAMASKDSFTAVSYGDQMHIGAGAGVNLAVGKEGDMTFNNEKGNFKIEAKDGAWEQKIKDAIKILSDSGALHVIAQEAAKILSKNGGVFIQSQGSDGVHVKADSGNIAHDAPSGNYYMQSNQAQDSSPESATGGTGTSSGTKPPSSVKSDQKSIDKLT